MSDQPFNIPSINVAELSEKGEKIYQKHAVEWEKDQAGRYVAIEVESEECFIEDTSGEALKIAKDKYPDKLFFVRRIGEVTKVSRHFIPSYGSSILR